jgi:hypothetical protein
MEISFLMSWEEVQMSYIAIPPKLSEVMAISK